MSSWNVFFRLITYADQRKRERQRKRGRQQIIWCYRADIACGIVSRSASMQTIYTARSIMCCSSMSRPDRFISTQTPRYPHPLPASQSLASTKAWAREGEGERRQCQKRNWSSKKYFEWNSNDSDKTATATTTTTIKEASRTSWAEIEMTD